MTSARPSSIRFPDALRERLVDYAQHDRRTFSNTVIVLLEHALADRPAPPSRPALPGQRDLFDAIRETDGGAT